MSLSGIAPVIFGEGFVESRVVDLDRHAIDEDLLEDYDYMSDSDLDTDDEGMEDNASTKYGAIK